MIKKTQRSSSVIIAPAQRGYLVTHRLTGERTACGKGVDRKTAVECTLPVTCKKCNATQ